MAMKALSFFLKGSSGGAKARTIGTMAKKRRTCPCGHDRDHFWVSPQAKYSTMGFILGVFMGVSGMNPKSIRFRCRQCGHVVEERSDAASIRKYKEH